MKLYILYASYGAGHKSIAQYLKKYLEQSDDTFTVKIMDLLDVAKNKSARLAGNVSEKIMAYCPLLWSAIYKVSDTKTLANWSLNGLSKMIDMEALKLDITSFHPDYIISTYFLTPMLLSKMKINSPLLSVVTDYYCQSIWLNHFDRNTYFIAPSKEEKERLETFIPNASNIYDWGVPVFPSAKESFSFSKFTCLFMAGGRKGVFRSLRFLKALLKRNLDIHIIFVAGLNKNVYKKALLLKEKYQSENLEVVGFISNVLSFMQASDIVVSKPGGVQISEALKLQKPLLLMNSAGGQETKNYKYFVKKGWAKYFKVPEDFASYVETISKNPLMLKTFRTEPVTEEDVFWNILNLLKRTESDK